MKGLHVDSVIKSYGTNRILTDIHISCQKGEIVGLLGRNGCGKSTLLKIIFGLLGAESSFVSVDGVPKFGLAERSQHIRYLSQDGFLPNYMKVKMAIDLFCDAQSAEELYHHPLICPVLNSRGRELSGGERRFVEILLMIHCDAEFILTDEPFNGISPINICEVKEMIRDATHCKGFIVTDHDYEHILDIADRVMLICDGAIREIHGEEDLRYWGYII